MDGSCVFMANSFPPFWLKPKGNPNAIVAALKARLLELERAA
jgi:hypothetical protein